MARIRITCFYCGKRELIDVKDMLPNKNRETHVCEECSDKIADRMIQDILQDKD